MNDQNISDNVQKNFFRIYEKFVSERPDLRGADREFAELIGITTSLLSMIKNGERRVTPNVARKVERAFGIPRNQLDFESICEFNARPQIEKENHLPPILRRIIMIAATMPEAKQTKLLLYTLDLHDQPDDDEKNI